MAKNEAFAALVQEARARVRETTIDEVHRRRAAGESFHLIDVRDAEEVCTGRVPASLNISKGVIERDIATAIPDTSAEIITYCGGGSRSVLAADALQKMGYTNVASMAGGMRGWRDAGHEVEGEA